MEFTVILGYIINVLSVLYCFYWGVIHHGILYMSLCFIIVCNLPIFHHSAHIIIVSQKSIVNVICLCGPFDLSHCVNVSIMWYLIICVCVLQYICHISFIFCITCSNTDIIVVGQFYTVSINLINIVINCI